MNFYNDNSRDACHWIGELVKAKHLPEGAVDQRSITEIQPVDLGAYQQCHFFAGIGGWPYALQLAGWPEERPVWTGSCPCQPFSCAGKQLGESDERHLWPEFRRLISECRPATIFGEQVASSSGRLWLAGVRTDLEGMGYEVGAADLCAAGIGSPHIRQRLYWVANAVRQGSAWKSFGQLGPGYKGNESHGGVANAECNRGHDGRGTLWTCDGASTRGEAQERGDNMREVTGFGSTGFWTDSEWLPCLDGKARRIESGTFPLVAGLPRGVVPSGDISAPYAQATGEGRVMRLRGYGNSIVPQLAAEFIGAFLDTL